MTHRPEIQSNFSYLTVTKKVCYPKEKTVSFVTEEQQKHPVEQHIKVGAYC